MRISVVMPTLDEAANMAARAHELAFQAPPWEWIVADGGSGDSTRERAALAGARVVDAPRGRARQCNAGAAAAGGDVLLFLHADTALPNGAFAAIRGALADPRIAGGNFTLRFADARALERCFATIYAFRQRVFGIAYGDSAMFLRRDAFASLDGFRDQPVMEDFDLYRRARRRGAMRRLPLMVTTSARRFKGRVFSSLVRWIVIETLYRLGVSATRLVALYPPHVPSPRPGSRAR